MSREAQWSDGSSPVSASVMWTAGANVISTSPPPSLPVGKKTELQTSAQDEQPRSSEDPVSSGHLSGNPSGQPLGHSPGQPCDSSCGSCVAAQHSTRTPARQSAGIPTSPQTTTRIAGIRMRIVYGNASGRSTSCGTMAGSFNSRLWCGSVPGLRKVERRVVGARRLCWSVCGHSAG